MEAVWTRYFPLSIKIRELVKSQAIGPVHRVIADLSLGVATEDGKVSFDDSHRMVNKDLAGGALLDLGIYALTWNFQILYLTQDEPKEKPTVVSAINKYDRTGADEMTSVILSFPKQKTMGIALTGMRVATNLDEHDTSGPSIKIQGAKGEIQVYGPAYRPTHYKIMRAAEGTSKASVESVQCDIPTDPERDGWGHGMFWEADEAARCLRDGKLQSETLSWAESVLIMETMDTIREQGGLTYPEIIESTEFSAKSPLNLGKA